VKQFNLFAQTERLLLLLFFSSEHLSFFVKLKEESFFFFKPSECPRPQQQSNPD